MKFKPEKLIDLHPKSVFICTLFISFVPDLLLSCRFYIGLIRPLASVRVLVFCLSAIVKYISLKDFEMTACGLEEHAEFLTVFRKNKYE